jgi:hypothetical protein
MAESREVIPSDLSAKVLAEGIGKDVVECIRFGRSIVEAV